MSHSKNSINLTPFSQQLSPLSNNSTSSSEDEVDLVKSYPANNWEARSKSKFKRLRNAQIRVFKRPISIWILIGLLGFIYIFISTKLLTEDEHLWSNESDDMHEHELTEMNNIQSQANKDSLISELVISSKIDAPFQIGCREIDTTQPRANAALVVLARNSEVKDVVKSMMSLERHFNQWFNYPWVFLNDEPFTDEFKEIVKQYTSSEVEFGTIPTKEWNFKEDIDKDELYESIESQGDRTILYGNLESYHKMCRFYSGFFYKHELVKKREWYWRVEPNVEFFCDLTYDPFIEMEKRGKKYGFTVMIGELYYTIPGLFKETKAFIKKNKLKVGNAWNLFVKNSRYSFGKNEKLYDGLTKKEDILLEIERNIIIKKFLEISKKKDKHVKNFNAALIKTLTLRATDKPNLYEDRVDWEEYNFCHFWSNFEIARTDLFNSPEYVAYFKHLDVSGGFYRERWGDAPVHSLAVGMMLDTKDIHYFRDIGYRHSTQGHCPGNAPKNQLRYKPSEKYDQKNLRKDRYWLKPNKPTASGIGCRCRCPWNHKEIEDSSSSCIKHWHDVTKNNFKVFEPIDLDYWENVIEKRIENYLSTGGELGESSVIEELLR